MEGFTATLDILVQREEHAYNFYTALAKMVDTEAMRQTLIGFAEEELKHKEKLIGMKGRKGAPPVGKILDLKISDEVDSVTPRPNMTYKEALIIAIKKEQSAYRLYSELASITVDEKLRNTLLTLAQEEANHKLRFELAYDKVIQQENT